MPTKIADLSARVWHVVSVWGDGGGRPGLGQTVTAKEMQNFPANKVTEAAAYFAKIFFKNITFQFRTIQRHDSAFD